MKKYMWLMVLVLWMSTTAWGICQVDVGITQMVPGGVPGTTDVAARVWITCPEDCVIDHVNKSQHGNIIYLDYYLTCTFLDGPSALTRGQWILRDAPCGLYIVVARVWCTYEGPACWPYCMFNRPIFCGMGSTYVRLCYPCAVQSDD